MTRKLVVLACGVALLAGSGLALSAALDDGTPVVRLTPVKRYPHDPRAFTQGFAWHDGDALRGHRPVRRPACCGPSISPPDARAASTSWTRVCSAKACAYWATKCSN